MRIAFLTYEYPPDIAKGGIGTYVNQIAHVLAKRNHDVNVFCASPYRDLLSTETNVKVHRIKCVNPSDFNSQLLDLFTKIHELEPFDIIESPEIFGHAYLIKNKYPRIPLVVKFHMPIFLQMRLINFYTSRIVKLRYFLGALRRGRISFYGDYDRKEDIDYLVASIADACISPSISLGEILIREWKLLPSKVTKIPYPFVPPPSLLQIPIIERETKVISFIGKLNVQKGVVALVQMIKFVVSKHPDVCFRFIGEDSVYQSRKMLMSEYIRKELVGLEKNYIIKGGLEYAEVISELYDTDICIFPSIWENFPNVCLEAMSAGRAVIGSKNGGMQEMLANGCGVLIDPVKVRNGSKAIVSLLNQPKTRVQIGTKARLAVLDRYNADKIGSLIETQFTTLIRNED